MDKEKARLKKAHQRALKAAPFPKPRGRVPRGSNGAPQVWDKQRGGWHDADTPAWSSTMEFPDVAAVALPIEPAAPITAAPVAAAPTIAWEPPIFWQLEKSGRGEDRRVLTRVREHVQLTPRGSRMHSFEHISPGGTTRLEKETSPADMRASREQRCGWRSRIACARMQTRVKCYRTACMHCGTKRLIQPDGCMQRHSIGPSLNARQRAEYRESQAYAEHEWECPGSLVYYGPSRCEESASDESEDDDEE